MDFVSAGRAKLAQRRGYARTNECHECNRPPKVGAILSQRPFPVMMSMQAGKGSTLFAHLKAGWVYCDGRYQGVNGLRDHCFLGLIRGLGGLPRRKVPKTRCAATTAAKVSVSVTQRSKTGPAALHDPQSSPTEVSSEASEGVSCIQWPVAGRRPLSCFGVSSLACAQVRERDAADRPAAHSLSSVRSLYCCPE